MNRYITKITSIIKYASFLASVIPFGIAVLSVFFMENTIPIHFDRNWVVDGYGNSLTVVLEGFVLSITALVLPIGFERIKMVDYGKLIGFIGALVSSLVIIGIQVYLIEKTFEISSVITLANRQEVVSFICSIFGVIVLLFGSVSYFLFGNTSKFNLKNMIIAMTFCVVGGLVSFLCLIVKNYFAILILCIGIVVCMILSIIVMRKRIVKSKFM